MIGIDLLTDTAPFGAIHYQVCGNTGQSLCQGDGSAAMQDTHGLAGTMIHRHDRSQIVIADLGELNPHPFSERVSCNLL